ALNKATEWGRRSQGIWRARTRAGRVPYRLRFHAPCQIAAQQRTLWFERGRHQQVFAPAARVAATDAAETASEPGVSEGRVHTDGLVEPVDGFAGPVLRREQEAFQCQRLGIARTQFEA